MRHLLPVVLLLKHRQLLGRKNAANLIAELVHGGGIQGAAGRVRAYEAVNERLDLLLLLGHEPERRKSIHIPAVEHLR
jgi:hypothetical protein